MQATKHSKQRDLLIDILRNTKCHPDADWIYTRAREQMPNISLGTVYRNLAKLSEDGTILKLDIGKGSDHFDGDITPHAHLLCESCGNIIDIFNDYTKVLKPDAEEKSQAVVSQCSVLFKGKCCNCKNLSV